MDSYKEKENCRKLSEAEKKRKAEFEALSSKLETQGYKKKDLTVGIMFANIMTFVIAAPFIGLFTFWFLMKNQNTGFSHNSIENQNVFLLFIVLVFIHELLHGIVWAAFAKNHWKSISFGFMAKYLTPYCTCKEPLKKSEYIIGGLMPTLCLGILPAIISIYTGSDFIFYMSMIMILCGGGDMMIVLKLILLKNQNPQNTIYIDHPYQAGLVMFER